MTADPPIPRLPDEGGDGQAASSVPAPVKPQRGLRGGVSLALDPDRMASTAEEGAVAQVEVEPPGE